MALPAVAIGTALRTGCRGWLEPGSPYDKELAMVCIECLQATS